MLRYCHHWFCRSLDWLCSDVRWQQQVQLCTVLLSSSKVKREASSPKSNKWRAPRLSLVGSNGLFGSYAGAGTTHIGDQPRPGWYVQPVGGGGLDQPCSSQMESGGRLILQKEMWGKITWMVKILGAGNQIQQLSTPLIASVPRPEMLEWFLSFYCFSSSTSIIYDSTSILHPE